jgi:cysteine desulfurase
MIYLDYNATAPLRPEAKAAMLAALEVCGNASSIHAGGRRARGLIEEARAKVASLVGAGARSVIFTGGGTEANAMALKGAVAGAADKNPISRLLISAIEHDSVRGNARAIAESMPCIEWQEIPVTAAGVADANALRVLLEGGKSRALISIMAANNETGVVQPIEAIATLAKEHDALLHIDAVQAAGRLPLDFNADYLTLSAHKLGGPQGAGALVVKEDAPFSPLIAGGGQELNRRAGTENVAAIAGFGAAAETVKDFAAENARLAALRDGLETKLKSIAADAVIFGVNAPRLAHTSNFAIPGLAAETAIIALDLDGVAVSSGAACSSGKVSRSHVLKAMGVDDELSRCGLRVSMGWASTGQDVDAALASLKTLLDRKRARALAAA